MTHTLPPLPYAYNALEPIIDEMTMRIHHTKHHQTYVDKLNAALSTAPQFQEKELVWLLENISSLPESIKTAVQNHGGGHHNHSLFWTILSPSPKECTGTIKSKIDTTFGSFDKFKELFTNAALNRFGSGWAWLVKTKDGKLEVLSTLNQDSPLMQGKTPILGLDVWEHAYYLKYQNKRAEYVENFFKIINWERVNQLLG